MRKEFGIKMSIVLMIYENNAFKEFILPAVNNADYQILLHKDIFGLKQDIKLKLEVIENKWNFCQDDQYIVKRGSLNYFKTNIKDGDLLELALMGEKSISIIVMELRHSFSVFKKYHMKGISEITIGKNDSNTIQYDLQDLVSRSHSILKKNGDGWYITDLSANGIFINSIRISGSQKLSFGDTIHIFGLQIVFLGDVLAVGARSNTLKVNETLLRLYENCSKDKQENNKIIPKAKKKYFNRSPRNLPVIYSEALEIEEPPGSRHTKEKPLFLTIGPAFTMAIPMLLGCALAIVGSQGQGGGGGAFMYTGILTAVSSAILGVVWALANIKYTRKEEKEEEEFRFAAYGKYLVDTADFVKEKYEKNREVLLKTYASAQLCASYHEKTPVLWNRNHNHEDFLFTRLGLGTMPFQVNISIPKKRFTLNKDALAQKPEMILENFKTLYDVPVGFDLLTHRLIGIIGGKEKTGAVPVVHAIAAQIAANNCYTDVKMAFIYDEKNEQDIENWGFAKWLPHVWSEDKKTRFTAADKLEASDVFYELTNILRMRAENVETRMQKRIMKPYYILFIQNLELLEGELISKYIFDSREEYGLTTFLMAENYEDLPNSCVDIIRNDADYTGFYNVLDNELEKGKMVLDDISANSLNQFARTLSRIEVSELESSGNIPNTLDFFEMYEISSLEELGVMERWRKNRTYDSMRSLIGKKTGGNDCYLDIHEKYHGPHGLIAGTTGSGKSETLQTYMLSLAVNFSPDDIGFFVIDFKGGGMANLFSGLPHMIGQISNLSGNQVHRAMVSIKSENMRRQRIFNEHGVNNINLYTRLLKNNEAAIPVPHLFIIIDEFAELKREEPDFMRELISVAQVGRSLGVHLILATQKPSGTVDDNIWSNAKFRLCLRVQDRQDSNDMLHKPDAAYITQPGRSYLQVGNDEIYELFQSGFSGAVYDEKADVSQTAIAAMLTMTGKAALVGSRLKMKQKEHAKVTWLSEVAECIKKAQEQLSISTGAVLNDPDKLSTLLSGTYQMLKEKGIDYAQTPNNTLRLSEFIYMWPDGDFPLEQFVRNIMRRAAQSGKKLPEMKEKTQLDAVVEYLADLAVENGYVNNLQLWLPVLPERLYLEQLDGYSQSSFNGSRWIEEKGTWTLEALIGLMDDPENQAQQPLTVNFAENGHHAVCGTVVSGKSTFLQSLIYSLVSRYTPAHVNIYALDFSSRMLSAFEGLAHVGGILYENDEDKIGKFFNMLRNMLEERKKLLQGGNYSQYVQVHGVAIPSVVIVIDNYANFKEKTENLFEDILIQLSRDGAGYGIFMVIASAGFGSAEIQSRIGDNIRTVICLEMGDKFKYADAMRIMHFNVLPEADIRGRGLAAAGGNILEFQTALAIAAEDDYQRSEYISEVCSQMNQAWTGFRAKKIPEIPEQPVLSEYSATEEYSQMLLSGNYLPAGYYQEDASFYGVDLRETYCYMITGKSRTGKKNLLKVFIHAASRKNARICIMDQAAGEFRKTADTISAEYIQTDAEMFEFWKGLTGTFIARNKLKRAYLEEGLEDSEIYENFRSQQQIFIFIADIAAFVQSIYNPQDGVGAMSGFMENISEKGRLHNIFFIGNLNVEDTGKLMGLKVYENFIGCKSGIHLGGNISAQRMFNFSNIPFSELSKTTKAGTGMTPSKEDETQACRIVIPLVKR